MHPTLSALSHSRKHLPIPFFLGKVSAGKPFLTDGEVSANTVDINEILIKNPIATFFMKAEGDSMTGAGIFTNDILVIDRSEVVPKNWTVGLGVIFPFFIMLLWAA